MEVQKLTGKEPATPVSEEATDRIDAGVKIYSGLTIRQHFASMAAQGILAGADLSNQNGIYVNGGFIHPATVAKDAVQISDALIEELNKPYKPLTPIQ